MTEDDIRQRYSIQEYDKRVNEYMNLLIDALVKEYGYLKREWLLSLDMIAQNYQIYIQCYDSIRQEGMYVRDDQGRRQRNPASTLMMSAQNSMQKLTNSFALTPLSYSKVRKLESPDNSDDYIDSLTN